MSTMEQRILDELVYDRVRSTVNLCQLVIVEQELDESIQRAMVEPGAGGQPGPGTSPGKEPGELAREHVQRAWERLEREWRTLREDLARAECARCVRGAGCAESECDAP